MRALIIDAWIAAVNRLCQFTVDRLPPIISAPKTSVESSIVNVVLLEASGIKSLLTLFEKSENDSIARLIAGKCETVFSFWERHMESLPESARSELARIEKLFHIVCSDIAPAADAEEQTG